MSRQKTVTKVTRKTSKQKPVGFFKEGGKTKPITKPKAKKAQKRKVKKVVEAPEYVSKEAYKGGYGAHLTFEMEGEDGEVFTVDTDIRWETMKAERLVNTEHRTPDGKKVNMRYIGPSKRQAWIDEDGDERVPADVQLGQLLPDGSWEPIDPFQMTKVVEAEPRGDDAEVNVDGPTVVVLDCGHDLAAQLLRQDLHGSLEEALVRLLDLHQTFS